MEFAEIGSFEGTPIRVPTDYGYRTCDQCGGDCAPDPMTTDNGIRIAFICREHGIQSRVDPFKT